MALFRLEPRQLWGDYGQILIGGMTCHLGRMRGKLQLERTGPFVPPLTLSGTDDVLVTSALRTKMEKSGLFDDVRFRKAIKARIVRLEWHAWDLGADRPRKFPNGGEPENYVLARRHSEKLALEMGDIYEALLSEGGTAILYDNREPWNYKVKIQKGSWNGCRFFRARSWHFVDGTAKSWLNEQCGEWIRFIRTPY